MKSTIHKLEIGDISVPRVYMKEVSTKVYNVAYSLQER